MFSIICGIDGEVVYEHGKIEPCEHIDEQSLLDLVEYIKIIYAKTKRQ